MRLCDYSYCLVGTAEVSSYAIVSEWGVNIRSQFARASQSLQRQPEQSQPSNHFIKSDCKQMLFDSNLKVMTEEFILWFISAWDRTVTHVYSNLAMHPCTLSANFKGFLWKTTLCCPHLHNKLPHKSLPANKATLHWIFSQTELHWMIEVELSCISSARLRDQSEWRQAVSETGPRSEGLPWGLLCLAAFTLQNMHCLKFTHCVPLSISLLLVALLSEAELLFVFFMLCWQII